MQRSGKTILLGLLLVSSGGALLASVGTEALSLGPSMAFGLLVGGIAALFLLQPTTLQRKLDQQAAETQINGLQESLQAKDDYLANTVHELRTPLTSIMAALEIAQDGHLLSPEEIHDFLRQATTSSRHMMFLINDLLDVTAIGANKIKMEPSNCALANLLDNACRSLQSLAKMRQVEIQVEPNEQELRVRADASRVLQVLINLISNATKYSPEASKVFVRAHAKNDLAVIEVEDQGQGIPAELHHQLFTRFCRFESSKNVTAAGTGIGLHLSKMLVNLMGGTIGYRNSENDSGSVFWFSLPLITSGQESSQEVDPVHDLPSISDASSGPASLAPGQHPTRQAGAPS